MALGLMKWTVPCLRAWIPDGHLWLGRERRWLSSQSRVWEWPLCAKDSENGILGPVGVSY